MDFHDPVAAGLHLGYALWSLFAGAILLRLTRRHPTSHRIAIGVYALSVVMLYTCSGLFHSFRYLPLTDPESDPQFEFFRRLDLAAIFGLIAGSCIVTFVYLLPKWWMRASVAAEAAFGITGIVLVWSLRDVVAESLLYVYVAMGLIALVPGQLLYRELRHRGMALLFLFAAFYVGAAVVQATGWPVLAPGLFGAHELFHLGNMIATLLHFVLLVKFALPRGAAARRRTTHDPRDLAAAASAE